MISDIAVPIDTGQVILDTKWKRLDPGQGVGLGIAQADLYQLAASGHAYAKGDRPRLALIHPHVPALGAEDLQRSWRIAGSDLPLEVWTIDTKKPRTAKAWRALAQTMVGDAHLRPLDALLQANISATMPQPTARSSGAE